MPFALALDRAARTCGVNFIGGYSALVQKGMTEADEKLIRSIPEALSRTELVCSSVNVGSTRAGINMDAVALMGRIVKDTAAATADRDGLGCAKLVVFCNAVEDNPFMAGAFHGVGEAEKVINVGVSGPGVVCTALKAVKGQPFDVVAETVKKTAFRVTRMGQLVAQEASRRLDTPFGIVDLSLAPTPAIGDSVARILEEMGLEVCGTHGTTAALALLNDAVKKGGVMASSSVGGLSGAFIPVSEDEGMIAAAEAGTPVPGQAGGHDLRSTSAGWIWQAGRCCRPSWMPTEISRRWPTSFYRCLWRGTAPPGRTCRTGSGLYPAGAHSRRTVGDGPGVRPQPALGRRHPDRICLDAAAPENPVVICHQSGHMGVFNTAALERLGVTAQTPAPAGGVIGRENGTLTGYMEENAFLEFQKRVPMMPLEAFLGAYRKAQDLYASYGITTVQEGLLRRGAGTPVSGPAGGRVPEAGCGCLRRSGGSRRPGRHFPRVSGNITGASSWAGTRCFWMDLPRDVPLGCGGPIRGSRNTGATAP